MRILLLMCVFALCNAAEEKTKKPERPIPEQPMAEAPKDTKEKHRAAKSRHMHIDMRIPGAPQMVYRKLEY